MQVQIDRERVGKDRPGDGGEHCPGELPEKRLSAAWQVRVQDGKQQHEEQKRDPCRQDDQRVLIANEKRNLPHQEGGDPVAEHEDAQADDEREDQHDRVAGAAQPGNHIISRFLDLIDGI